MAKFAPSANEQPPKEWHLRLHLLIFAANVANCLTYFIVPSLHAYVGSRLLYLTFGFQLSDLVDNDAIVRQVNAIVGFFVMPQCFSLLSALLVGLIFLRRVLRLAGLFRNVPIERDKIFWTLLFVMAVTVWWNFSYFEIWTDKKSRASGMPLGYNVFATAIMSWLTTSLTFGVLLHPIHTNRNLKI
jgi:hypothetical protein